VIELEEDDAQLVNLMLTFLYTGDYEYTSPEELNVTPLTFHARMYTLADKYIVPPLIRAAEKKYEYALGNGPKLDDYFLSIPGAYTPPASIGGLRTAVVQYARRILKKNIAQESVRGHLRGLLTEVPEYVFEVLEVFVTSPPRDTCCYCGEDIDFVQFQAECMRCRGGSRRGRVNYL